MKKLLLLSFLVAFANFAFGQATLYEDFNSGFPAGWTTINNGNDTTWTHVSDVGLNSSGGIELDTYPDAADDWLITPQFSVNQGDLLSFYAECNASYPDTITVEISSSGTTASDFTIDVASIALTGEYVKYTYDLTGIDGVADGDNIYVGIHCQSNGSRVHIDNFKVAPYQFPNLTEVYNLDKTTLNVLYDGEVATDSITVDDYKLVSGKDTITFGNYSIDNSNNNLVHITDASEEIIGDNVLDTLHFQETQYVFYAGFTPIEYTSLTNPDGTMKTGYNATYTGVVTETNYDKYRVWIADGAGAHNSINTSGTTLSSVNEGDSIIIYGEFSPNNNQSEIYKPTFVKTISEDNELYDPVIISAAYLDISITPDTDPAEKYEGSLVELENLKVDKWDGNYYFYASNNTSDTVRIGDRFSIFDRGFDSTALEIGDHYTLKGLVVGRDAEYQLNPRDVYDITPLDDNTAPQITCDAQTVTNQTGQTVSATSNEIGKIYLILEGEAHSTVDELKAAVDIYKGATAMADSNKATTIPVNDIIPGTYYAYAVDRNGNISEPSVNTITIENASYELPYTQTFDDSTSMPDDFVLANEDGGTPATSLEIYQSLKEDAFKVIPVDTLSTEDYSHANNIVIGTSWYEEEVDADDWLILPKVKLSENTVLSWEALSLTSSGTYTDDYEIYVSTTHQTVEDCKKNDPVFSITGENASTDADSPGNGVAERTLNLADKGYTNQDVYIAFRLMTPYPGGDRLALNNIMLYEPDVTAPEVTAEAQTVTIGEDVYVQSSEAAGKVYIIEENEPQSTPGELETAVNVGTAASAEVTAADTDIAISTTDLASGTYYAYAVDSAKNMSSKSSNAITLEEDEGTNILNADNQRISIYPNPVKDEMRLITDIKLSKASIYNALGQKVKEVIVQEQNATINTADLDKGIYFITFETENESIKTGKFIKE